MIWLVFLLMTVATVAAVVYPLVRPHASLPARGDYDIAVYRDQLAELERDIERGTLSDAQAEAARLEIQRRILAADTAPPPYADNSDTLKLIALFIALIFPFVTFMFYGHIGSPYLADRPYVTRRYDPDFRLNTAAEKIAIELQSWPDAQGYRSLARMYYALLRFDDAAEACRKSIELGTDDVAIWSLLGESLVMANGGTVVMDAMNAFKTALARDPSDPRARFYIGLGEAEIGNYRRAVGIWRDMARNAPRDAPWLRMVKHNIILYGIVGGFDPASIPPVPPKLK